MHCVRCGEKVWHYSLEYDGKCPYCQVDLDVGTAATELSDDDEWLRVDEAAKFARISPGTLMGYIESGDLTHEKVEGDGPSEMREIYLISLNSLYELLEKRGQILAKKLKGKSRKHGRVRKITGPL